MSLDETLLTHGTASPFLPGTSIQYAWDSTCLGLIKTCPRLYQYTMIEGWTGRSESIHLRFGIEYHHALEFHAHQLAEGIEYEIAIQNTIREVLIRTEGWDVDQSTKAGKYKNRESLLSLVVDYLDHFTDDPCSTYIRSDGVPAVELSFRFELDWGPEAAAFRSTDPDLNTALDLDAAYIESLGGDSGPTFTSQPYLLSGHLDRVVSFNDHLFVMDHKTTTTTPGDRYFDQYDVSNQMTLYTLAGQMVLHSPIKGVMIRAAQILLEKPHRFIVGFTYRTPDQIEEWLADLRIHLSLAEQYAVAGYWPMNDTACDKYGGCKFRGVCSKSPHVREMFLRSDCIPQP